MASFNSSFGRRAEDAERAAIRAQYARRYVGYDKDGNTVTVLTQRCLVTHAHGPHAQWRVGTQVPVWLDLQLDGQWQEVCATVGYISRAVGYVLLCVDQPIMRTPVVDTTAYPSAPFALVDASACGKEVDPAPTRLGYVLSTKLDLSNVQFKGEAPPGVGVTGGGCFPLHNGGLFAICLASSDGQCALLPIAVPRSEAQYLEEAYAQRQGQ